MRFLVSSDNFLELLTKLVDYGFIDRVSTVYDWYNGIYNNGIYYGMFMIYDKQGVLYACNEKWSGWRDKVKGSILYEGGDIVYILDGSKLGLL